MRWDKQVSSKMKNNEEEKFIDENNENNKSYSNSKVAQNKMSFSWADLISENDLEYFDI